MQHPQRLQIANRIHLELVRELGQGIDVRQMLNSALYARDVLLVCQAYPGSELQRLAEQFRDASAVAETAAPSSWPRSTRGDSSLPPADSAFDTGFGQQRATRRWFSPSSWFAPR